MSSLGSTYGILPETIWNWPDNASLRVRRKNMNVLKPGDVVAIPPLRFKEESGQTEQRHRFMRNRCPSRILIRLLKNGEPLVDAEYTLDVEGIRKVGRTDGDGWLNEPVPPQATCGRLALNQSGRQYELIIGGLDPVEEVRGLRSRLLGLGFNPGPENGKETHLTEAALREFQRLNGLDPTGDPDDDTVEKLKQIYGA